MPCTTYLFFSFKFFFGYKTYFGKYNVEIIDLIRSPLNVGASHRTKQKLEALYL